MKERLSNSFQLQPDDEIDISPDRNKKDDIENFVIDDPLISKMLMQIYERIE